LTDNDSFCCYESEDQRNGLLANCYLAATKNNDLMKILMDALNQKETVVEKLPWEATGPLFLTETVKQHDYQALTIYPSHYFIPRHFTSRDSYGGDQIVYCRHHWLSTLTSERENHANAVALNHKGEFCFEAGQFKEATAWFKKSISTCADYAEPHNNLAVLYYSQHKIQEALDCLGEALRINPASADALANLQAIGAQLADQNLAVAS